MRPTDPRENLYPVLPPETYRQLGIPMPRQQQQSYGTGGPVSASGTPYLTGNAVSGQRAATVTPNPAPPQADPSGAPGAPAPAGPPPPGPSHGGPVLPPGTVPPGSAPGWNPAPGGPGEPHGPKGSQHRAVWIVVATTAVVVAIIVATTWYIVSTRTGDDERRIREVIAAETQAVNARDMDALIKTRCAADVQQLQLRFTPQTFAAEVDTLIGPGGSWRVTVLSVAVDKTAGTATAEETTEPVGQTVTLPQTVSDTAHLRKESGAWKVCVSSSGLR
ncbi:hypothetical protein [Tsukamurella sp. 1534]|uniref:Rv0361 family membrane protein n=1 Tax=Tsukamurella sp. 1534 TaxID=1151061 RepID=UPI00030F7B21|nr:hypothetical protein [Tsukamurella sp. 1534]